MTKQVLGALVLLAICAWWPIAHAHEVRPGFLEIRALGDDTFDVLWKVPANGEYRLAMYVKLPAKCKGEPTSGTFVGGAFVERWRAACPSFEIAAEPNAWQVARTYLVLGIQHILSGVDHLLFVLGLLFLVGSWRRLVATVTAFTVAHSITLAAATLGLVYVPQTPIEAAIALSVMFVAAEIIHQANGRPGLTARAPWVVAFIFGLLHGFGFAGALREVGLPQSDIPVALLFFNVGVEVGQLMFILAVVAILWLASRLMGKQAQGQRGPWQAEALIRTPVAYVVGSTAAFWVVQRVVAFWA